MKSIFGNKIFRNFFNLPRLNIPKVIYAGQFSYFSFLYFNKMHCEENSNKFETENDMETKTSKVFFHTEEKDEKSLKIFSGSYHRELAKEIVSHLDVHLAKIRL